MASPFECAKDGQSIQGYAHLNAATRLTKSSSHGMFGRLIWNMKFVMDPESFKIFERIAHVQCFDFFVANLSCCGEETQEMLQKKELLASHIQHLASKFSGK